MQIIWRVLPVNRFNRLPHHVEVLAANTAMMRQMNNNDAKMGIGLDSAVLEFDRMPGGLFDSLPETVKVRPIWIKGRKSKRSFIVRWKDGDHDVRFVVTKGQATAAGVPRIDIHPWDNGNPPDPRILKSVVAATLQAIEEEAGEDKRNWGLKKGRYIPSPKIPLLASTSEIFKALFDASAERIVIPNADASNTFDATTLPIHVHILGKPQMIMAFEAVHAETRFFGELPTVPGVNYYKGNKPSEERRP